MLWQSNSNFEFNHRITPAASRELELVLKLQLLLKFESRINNKLRFEERKTPTMANSSQQGNSTAYGPIRSIQQGDL